MRDSSILSLEPPPAIEGCMPVNSPRSRKLLRVARAAWLGYTVLVSVIFVSGRPRASMR